MRRNDFGAGFANGESDDGGFEEFRDEFCPTCRFSSAFSARSSSTIACNSDSIARSCAFSAASSS